MLSTHKFCIYAQISELYKWLQGTYFQKTPAVWLSPSWHSSLYAPQDMQDLKSSSATLVPGWVQLTRKQATVSKTKYPQNVDTNNVFFYPSLLVIEVNQVYKIHFICIKSCCKIFSCKLVKLNVLCLLHWSSPGIRQSYPLSWWRRSFVVLAGTTQGSLVMQCIYYETQCKYPVHSHKVGCIKMGGGRYQPCKIGGAWCRERGFH